MKNHDDDSAEIQSLTNEVANLKSILFWGAIAFAVFVLLVVNPGLVLLAVPFLLIGGCIYGVHRFLRGLVVRRARINERLAPRRPRRRRLFGLWRAS